MDTNITAPQHLPADFQLVRTGGAGGKVIRLLQWANGDGFADYEHVRLYLGPGLHSGAGWGSFFEEQPGGAVIADHQLDGDGLFWSTGRITLTHEQRVKICAAARKYAAAKTGYSDLDYAALAAKRLNIPAPGLDAYIRATGHMICSQAICRCYWDGDAPLYDDWTGDETPADLYNRITR
jgi:hypothetical protein